jgi:DNA-binding transcriptional MerR regulator/quercetin dioxygenase-like cupin family protein
MTTRRTNSTKLSKQSIHFTISNVSRMINVSPSTLRIWDNVGLVCPGRTAGGYRAYTPPQIERLKEIQRLRVDKNLNVEAIRHIVGKEKKIGGPVASQPSSGASIARQLRKLRKQRGLTLADASAAMGLSTSFLSSLERAQTNASIATLQKLSVFYETNVLAFFGNYDQPRKLVKPHHRKVLSNEPGINIELLAYGKNSMEPHLFRIAPGASSGGSYHHEGEEFIYVIRGSCEIWLEEVEHYRLQPGDSLYFSSRQTHRWKNSGYDEAVLLWINTPPTF